MHINKMQMSAFHKEILWLILDKYKWTVFFDQTTSYAFPDRSAFFSFQMSISFADTGYYPFFLFSLYVFRFGFHRYNS